MSRGVVLITGINGFLGTYTALAFLDAGYTVKGTGRTVEKVQDWIKLFPAHKAAYQYAVVPDITAVGAFDDAVKGCDIIVHVASPNTQNITDNERDMLLPAIQGTHNLLESTKEEPRIRRVLFTSTLAAVANSARLEPGKLLTEEDWNNTTYEEAKTTTNHRVVYGASKALAERAFWDYIKEENPLWAGTALLPCGVFDAPIQPLSSLASLNRSVAFLWNIANGSHKAGLTYNPAHTLYISARDVGTAHLRAAELDAAKNQRYLLIGGTWTFAEVIYIIERNFPSLRDNLPPPPESGAQAVMFDSSKTNRELDMEFMPFEKVVVDTITEILVTQAKENA